MTAVHLQELALEELLAKVQARWGDVEFTVISYKEQKDVFILGGIEEIQVGYWLHMNYCDALGLFVVEGIECFSQLMSCSIGRVTLPGAALVHSVIDTGQHALAYCLHLNVA
jgi:hypothetical protein